MTDDHSGEDVLEHLEREHREVEQLLADLLDSDEGPERDQLLLDLEESLTLHMAVEEQHLYPLVAEVLDAEHVTEAHVEHDLARDGLAKLRALAAEPGFGAAVEMVQAGIAHHVQEEEDEVFPQLRERAGDRIAAMDPDSLEEQAEPVGDGLSTDLPAVELPAGDADGVVDLADGRGDREDLSSMTRDELYERARRAEVRGRSEMTKQQLVEALSS